MISDSPHLYHASGLQLGHAPRLIENAICQARIVENQGLAPVLTLGHLAHSTGANYSYLREIVKRDIDPYDDLRIRRRNGRKMRSISSPHPTLLEVQRWILDRIIAKLGNHHNSFAYSPGSSIKACARRHLRATWLVKLDIRNFFETISEAQVYEVFRNAGYRPLPSLELARICTRYAGHARHVPTRQFQHRATYDTIELYSTPLMGFVPQGAPTSGALANQVARKLDVELTHLAESKGLVYTRYADDMTFSSSKPFSRAVAKSVIRETDYFLRQNSFELHKQKTRIIPPGARKIVLGLLVDSAEPRLNKGLRARILYHVRGVEKFGLAEHVSHIKFSSIEGLVRHVGGLLAFASDIEPQWAEEPSLRWKAALRRSNWI